MSLIEFIDLGRQPLANGFVSQEQLDCPELVFSLRCGFSEQTCLVSLMEFVDAHLLFNDNYAYHSSGSQTMRAHFKHIASAILDRFAPHKVLEIGSNDGVFLRHFSPDVAMAVEPCKNFADLTRHMGYRTYNDFWTMELANRILDEVGPMDVVYAANCMCHIPRIVQAFAAVEHVLADGGVFIFEDPSLSSMISRNSYDQIYDEHAHLFSAIALRQLLDINDLVIWRIDILPVHGGSCRIYTKKACTGALPIEDSVNRTLDAEFEHEIDRVSTFLDFAQRVEKSKTELLLLLQGLRDAGKKIIGYGATSKSTVVYNYCGIGPDLIECVTDTTPCKQGMFMPGVHIPIVPPDGVMDSVDHAFLGAWNFEKEIVAKERAFCERGGRFITHVPRVRVI